MTDENDTRNNKGLANIRDVRSCLQAIQSGIANLSNIEPRVIRYSIGGHADWIRDIALHPDGKRVATGSDDHTARMWDLDSLVPLRTFAGHTDTVRAVAFSPDGMLLATGSWDRSIRLWNICDGACVRELSGHDARIRRIAFSPDGKFLYSASEDKTARRWNLADGSCALVFRGHAKSVRDLAVRDDDKIAYSADEDGKILAWDCGTGSVIGRFDGHADEVFALALDSGGSRLYSGGKDKVIRIWNTRTFEPVARFEGHGGWVMSLSLDREGIRLVSADLDGITKVWNLENDMCEFTHGGPTWVVNCVRFGLDPRTILFASEHRTVLLDANNGRVIREFNAHEKNVACFCIGRTRGIIATSSWDGTTIVWDCSTGAIIRSLSHPCAEKRGIISLCFSNDENRLFAGSDNGYVFVWNLATGRCVRSIYVGSDNIHGITRTADNSRIIIACRDLANNIRMYDTTTGSFLASFTGHANTVFAIDMNPAAGLLASGSADHTARVWDLESRKNILTLRDHTDWVEAVRFSRDGNFLLTGGCDSVIRMWDVRTGKLRREFSGLGFNVYSLDISPDDERVIASGNDKTIRMWDAATGRVIREYGGNDYQLYKAVFAPDSASILTGGKRSFRQWQLDNATVRREAAGHANAVCSMHLNSYTRELVIGCWEYGAKKISLDTCAITMHYASTMSSVYAVGQSPSGDKLVIGGRSMLTNLLDAKTGKQQRWFEHTDNVNALALGTRGDVLFTACSDGIVRKWDVASSVCRASFEGHEGRVTCLVLSRNECLVFSSGIDSTIRVWNADDATLLATLTGHSDEVNAIALDWNGRFLASGSRDGTMRIWDTSTLACVCTIRIGVEVTALAYGKHDEVVFIGCNDGSVYAYDCSSCSLVRIPGHTSRVSSIRFYDKTGCIISAGYDGTVKFWSADSTKLRATFHNLDRGFLWSAPPDDESDSGWLWTDRPELVGIVECGKDGADPRPLAELDEERARFIRTMTSKAKIVGNLKGEVVARPGAAKRIRHTEQERKLLP